MKPTPMIIVAVSLLAFACDKKDEAPKPVTPPEQEVAKAEPVPEEKPEEPAVQKTARAEVKTADGKAMGTATFEPVENGVRIKFEGSNLPPGKHGFHVHEVGKCEGPDFKSAGGHFAPSGKQHGLENPEGHHVGDMPNLEVADDGTGNLETVLEGAALDDSENSLLAGDGTALLIHGGPDDQKTDPAGDSGPRIACGVIEAPAT